MNIAELFVNLGIKGGEKTVSTLGNVKKGLGEIGSTSLEAKAGILGAMYGLERMMAISGAMGTGLTNFAALTGQSAVTLQKWQFAARQAGMSNEELTGSFKGVQNAMANMLMGKGAPEGIALVSKAVGGLQQDKLKDTFYMLTQLQKAMQTLSVEQGNIAGKSFGLSEGTIAAMRRNMFTPENFAKAPSYSDQESKSLDKSNIAWSNLGNKIQMAVGHFNAKHGQQLTTDISKVVDQVIKLAEAFEHLAQSTKLFQLIGKSIEGWAYIFGGMADTVDKSTKLGTYESEKKDAAGNKRVGAAAYFEDAASNDYSMLKQSLGGDALLPRYGHFVKPTVNNTTTVNQSIVHHGDAKDTQAVKDTQKAAVTHAYRQRSAQRQKN